MSSDLDIARSELAKCTGEEEYYLEKLTQARRLHNTLVPVSLLPPELLVKVFWLASIGSISYWDEPCPAHNVRSYYQFPPMTPCKFDIRSSVFYQLQSIRAVCRGWSDLVLGAGVLWSTVELAFPRTVATTITRSKESELFICARFGDCPLPVTGRSYPPPLDIFAPYETKESLHITQLITFHWKRIVHIDLALDTTEVQLLYDSIKSVGNTLPHLRTLHLSELNYQPQRRSISPPHCQIATASQPILCPTLETLCFTPMAFSSIPFVGARNLKRLTITARFESWVQISAVLATVSLVKETLEELTVKNQPYASISSPGLFSKEIDTFDGSIDAPRLRSLRLHGLQGDETLRIISSIHAPQAVCDINLGISGFTEFLRQGGSDHSIFPGHPYTMSLGAMGFQMKSLLPSVNDPSEASDQDSTSRLPLRFEFPAFLEFSDRPYVTTKDCIEMLGQLRIDHIELEPPQCYPLQSDSDNEDNENNFESPNAQPWWSLLFTALPHLTHITINPRDAMYFAQTSSLVLFAAALQGLRPRKSRPFPSSSTHTDEELWNSAPLRPCPCPHLKRITLVMDSEDFFQNIDDHMNWLRPVAERRSKNRETKLDQITLDLNRCSNTTFHQGMLPSDDRVLWNSKPLETMLKVLKEYVGEAVATRGVMRNSGHGWKLTVEEKSA